MDRRHYLAAVGAATVGGGALLSTQLPADDLSTQSPARGTWPHERYDTGNTAANRRAEPPSSPDVAWESPPLGGVDAMVADRERLYVGTDRTVALDRDEGTVAWKRSLLSGPMAVRGGRLYLHGDEHLRALDATTGETVWEERVVVATRGTLHVTDDLVLFGDDSLAAFAAETGERRWQTSAVGAGGGLGAVADGSLVAVDDGLVSLFGPRRASDAVTSAPPPVETSLRLPFGDTEPPVLVDGRVVVGTRFPHDAPDVGAVGLGTGEVEWTFESENGAAAARGPAVASGRAFVDRNYAEPGGINEQSLVALSLAEGSIDWQQSIDQEISRVVVAGDRLLVGTATVEDAPDSGSGTVATGGTLRAFGFDGQEQWRVEFDSAADRIVAVDDTVYVGTDSIDGDTPGRVYALS